MSLQQTLCGLGKSLLRPFGSFLLSADPLHHGSLPHNLPLVHGPPFDQLQILCGWLEPSSLWRPLHLHNRFLRGGLASLQKLHRGHPRLFDLLRRKHLHNLPSRMHNTGVQSHLLRLPQPRPDQLLLQLPPKLLLRPRFQQVRMHAANLLRFPDKQMLSL